VLVGGGGDVGGWGPSVVLGVVVALVEAIAGTGGRGGGAGEGGIGSGRGTGIPCGRERERGGKLVNWVGSTKTNTNTTSWGGSILGWSNSNSLAIQFGIHLLLEKQEKLACNSLTNQFDKNRNLAKLTSPHIYVVLRFL
jgi:hypothetical protein